MDRAFEFLPIGTILRNRSTKDRRLRTALHTLSGGRGDMHEDTAEAYINGIFSISFDRSPKKTRRAANKKRPPAKKYSNKVLSGVTFEHCPNCGGVTNCRLATGQLIEDFGLEEAAMRYHGMANDVGCVC